MKQISLFLYIFFVVVVDITVSVGCKDRNTVWDKNQWFYAALLLVAKCSSLKLVASILSVTPQLFSLSLSCCNEGVWLREADGSACGIVGRQKQREKELRGGLERLVMVVPCGGRVRLCPLDICASPAWWSSRLTQPCQLKTASQAAPELPAPLSLSLTLTPSFLRSFCQSLSIPFPSPLVVSTHECLLFPLSSFPHHYPASDLKPVNPLSALRAGSGQENPFQPWHT